MARARRQLGASSTEGWSRAAVPALLCGAVVRGRPSGRPLCAELGALAGARSTGLSSLQRSYRPMSEAWVYLLRCTDGSLYTGWTIDLERSLARHRAGAASRYTASRLPVELAHAIPMPDRAGARREEARVKRLPRADKLALLGAAQAPGTNSAGVRRAGA